MVCMCTRVTKSRLITLDYAGKISKLKGRISGSFTPGPKKVLNFAFPSFTLSFTGLEVGKRKLAVLFNSDVIAESFQFVRFTINAITGLFER